VFNQTIALFRYQLLGLINPGIIILLCGILLSAFLGSRFVAELAIINSEPIALAVMAESLRYSLMLLLIISLCYQISQDYELSQFERLLAMPVSRVQYVLAQLGVLLLLAFILSLAIFILMALVNDMQFAMYWSIAMFFEMVLTGQIAILAILSLEKLPTAVIFTLAIYLLARAAPLIDTIFTQSTEYYAEEHSFQLTSFIFSVLQYVLPGAKTFAQNNFLFNMEGAGQRLLQQGIGVLIYGLFLQFIILFDFYRKEFIRT